jgi:choline kinase
MLADAVVAGAVVVAVVLQPANTRVLTAIIAKRIKSTFFINNFYPFFNYFFSLFIVDSHVIGCPPLLEYSVNTDLIIR